MIFTKYSKDWIIIDESNYNIQEKGKVHLIKLDFNNPTEEKVKNVIRNFPNTNRYIISDNIKFYNNLLRNKKKYYVENEVGANLISFLRKNNKILLNMRNLSKVDKEFILYNISDMLNNIEVIFVGKKSWIDSDIQSKLEKWNGNVLIW